MNNKEYLIETTKRLYNLTLLFPKKEPLRYKMRETANDIAVNLLGKHPNSQIGFASAADKLEAMDGLFEIAKVQNWVKQEQLLNLQQEYSKIKQSIPTSKQAVSEIKKQAPESEPVPESKPVRAPEPIEKSAFPAQEEQVFSETPETAKESLPGPLPGNFQGEGLENKLNDRQDKIVAFLREQGRVQVKDVQEILPQVTKRTLRRDFQFLLNQEIVERIGQRNETRYQLKAEDRTGS